MKVLNFIIILVQHEINFHFSFLDRKRMAIKWYRTICIALWVIIVTVAVTDDIKIVSNSVKTNLRINMDIITTTVRRNYNYNQIVPSVFLVKDEIRGTVDIVSHLLSDF